MKNGKHVLIVEEDPELRSALADLMQAAGCETDLAANGADAINSLQGAALPCASRPWASGARTRSARRAVATTQPGGEPRRDARHRCRGGDRSALRSATEVEVQDPAEAFTALDRQVVVGRRRRLREQLVLEALVVPLEVVVLHVLSSSGVIAGQRDTTTGCWARGGPGQFGCLHPDQLARLLTHHRGHHLRRQPHPAGVRRFGRRRGRRARGVPMRRPDLIADCSRCAAVCCVALPFFQGCAIYDCYGAGPRVTKAFAERPGDECERDEAFRHARRRRATPSKTRTRVQISDSAWRSTVLRRLSRGDDVQLHEAIAALRLRLMSRVGSTSTCRSRATDLFRHLSLTVSSVVGLPSRPNTATTLSLMVSTTRTWTPLARAASRKSSHRVTPVCQSGHSHRRRPNGDRPRRPVRMVAATSGRVRRSGPRCRSWRCRRKGAPRAQEQRSLSRPARACRAGRARPWARLDSCVRPIGVGRRGSQK
jgi:CheY-like chemotaxis protein